MLVLDGPERTLLGLAAAVENGSSHPLGRAILERAAADRIPLRPARDAYAVLGMAVEATASGKRVCVGSPAHAARHAPLPANTGALMATWEAAGKTVVVVAMDGVPTGLIAVRDEPRADAAEGIRALRGMGVRSVMLTGGNPRTAQSIAAALGIEAHAGLLPKD